MRLVLAVFLLASAATTTACRTTGGAAKYGDYSNPAGGATDAPVAAKNDQERIRNAFGNFHL